MKKKIAILFYLLAIVAQGAKVPLFPKQEKTTLLYGFVDQYNNWIIKPQYHMAGHFGDGLAYAQKSGKEMYIDRYGKPVLTKVILPTGVKYKSKIHFDFNFPFRNGMAIVQMDDQKKVGAINTKGELVVPCIYAWIEGFSCGYSVARLPGEEKVFIINHKGEKITSKYNSMSSVVDGYSIVTDELDNTKKCGIFDIKACKFIVPVLYEKCRFYDYSNKEKIFGVRLNKKWGFVDANGKEIIPFLYDWVGHFSFGLCAVKQNGDWFYINSKGKRVTPIFDKAIYADDFITDNLAIVYYGRRGPYKYIYRNGDSVFPTQILKHYTRLNYLRGYIEIIVYKKMLFPIPLKILDDQKQNKDTMEHIRKTIPGLSDSVITLMMLANMCCRNYDLYRALDIFHDIIDNEKLTIDQKNSIQAAINQLNKMKKHRVNYFFQ